MCVGVWHCRSWPEYGSDASLFYPSFGGERALRELSSCSGARDEHAAILLLWRPITETGLPGHWWQASLSGRRAEAFSVGSSLPCRHAMRTIPPSCVCGFLRRSFSSCIIPRNLVLRSCFCGFPKLVSDSSVSVSDSGFLAIASPLLLPLRVSVVSSRLTEVPHASLSQNRMIPIPSAARSVAICSLMALGLSTMWVFRTGGDCRVFAVDLEKVRRSVNRMGFWACHAPTATNVEFVFAWLMAMVGAVASVTAQFVALISCAAFIGVTGPDTR